MIDSFLHNRNQKKTRAQLENLYKTFLRCKNLVFLALLTFVGAGNVWGQINISSTNSFVSTSLDGWNGTMPSGFTQSSTYRGTTAGTTGGTYAIASSGLGWQASSSASTLSVVGTYRNNTGSTQSSVTIEYDAFNIFTRTSRTPGWTVTSSLGTVSGLNWTYNSSSSNTSPDLRTITITGLNIAHNSTFTITWSSDRGAGSNSSPLIGLRNVKVRFDIALTAPTAPTITTITPGNGQLSVAFTAPTSDGGAAITNYAYSTDNGSSYTTLSTPSTTSPIVISSLTNNTTYDVKIRAINSVGSGAESNMVQGTPTNAATVPILTTPTVSNITPTSATLGATITSDGGSSISSRGTVFANTATPRGNLATEGGTAVGAFSHSRTGLSPNTLYYFAGFASNTPGTAYSSDGTFTTLHNAPSIGAGSGATTTAITANWTAPTGGGSASFTYEVALSTSSTFASTLHTQSNIASNTTNHTFTGLSEGTTYYFRVRAVNAGGNSDWSSISTGYATLNNAILLTALGTAAIENFDAMGSSLNLPVGCKMHASTSSPNWVGASLVVTQQASSGTPTAGGTYNWGSSVSERAIGAMSSSNFASPNNLLVKTRNTTGSVIENMFISYNAERYRVNTAAASISFFYSLDGTSWTAVNAGDVPSSDFPTGADAHSFTPPLQIPKSFVITGLNIANNSDFYLRWDINTTGTNSQGIGIDDISIKPCGTVSAPTASAAQSFCAGATIADLMATGTAIQWYAASSGGSSLSSSTALVDNTTYYVSQTISGCESVSRTAVTVTFKATHTWVGGSAGDWNTASNWCGGVPNSTSASVTIPSGTTVTLNTNASVAQLTIASGGTLTVSGTSQLTVASGGTFTNNGTFTAGTGTLIFAGSGTIAGSASIFHHLTLNGALTRSATTTTVNGILTMNANASLSAALSFGTSASLVYNVSAAYNVTDNEWPASNGPLNVTIQDNSTLLTLNNSKIINGTLTLTSGKISLGSNSLTANAFSGGSSSSFVITDGSGRLQTNVSTTAITFPVGPDASNYNPVTLTNNTGTPDDFAVLVFEEVTEDGTRNGTRRASPNRVNLTWDINKLTNASANAGNGVDFAFSWSNSQLKGSIQSSRFRVYHHDGSSWDPQMGSPSVSQSGGVTTLTYSQYKGSFSPFAIGDDVQLLPIVWGDVSLKYFTDSKIALIKWTTLSEENTAQFDVERSDNAMDWEKIYTIGAAGQSFVKRQYAFEDLYPLIGNSFYRVKQLDLDGVYTYSTTMPLHVEHSERFAAPFVFPIPASTSIYIRYEGHTHVKCSLLNQLGATVIPPQTISINPNNLFILDVQNVSSGSYLLKIETRFGIDYVKVIKD